MIVINIYGTRLAQADQGWQDITAIGVKVDRIGERMLDIGSHADNPTVRNQDGTEILGVGALWNLSISDKEVVHEALISANYR